MEAGVRPESVIRGSGTKLPIRIEIGDSFDFEQLVALCRAVYGRLPDGFCERYYRWQYADNPQGNAVIGNALCGTELVSHYAVLPMESWLQGKKTLVGLGVNALTRPDFQGQAIFARLVSQVEKAALMAGVTSVYVVPSLQSKPWFSKVLGFREWTVLPTWLRPLRIAPVLRSISRFAHKAGGSLSFADLLLKHGLRLFRARCNPFSIEIRKVDEFSSDFERLWEQEKAEFYFSIARSRRRLQWRFASAPTREYQIWGAYHGGALVSYGVSRVREFPQLPGVAVGVIADLFGIRDAPGRSGSRLLVARIIQWLYENHVDLCVAQMVSPSFQSALRLNGFFQAPAFLVDPRSILFRQLEAHPTQMAPARGIHFSGGDHDMG
jgi:GNAT superfamily N-acetyltransferase